MLCVYRVRRTSSIVFIEIHTITVVMLLYPVCATMKTAAANAAPHHSDNQIHFLPIPLQTRHYAQTEFPLHFVPETTFHPFRNRETYLFIFIFSHPQFSLSQSAITILLHHDHFHTTAFLRILLFLRGRKNFVQVLMNPTPSSERFAFCFIKHRISQTSCNGVHDGVV